MNQNLPIIFRVLVKPIANIVIGISLLFLLIVSNLWAGRDSVGTKAAEFLKLGVDARATGLGEAYTAISNGSESVYWNPAGLQHVEKNAFSFMHARHFQEIDYSFASYARRLGPKLVGGVGIQYLNPGTIDRTDRFGSNVGTFKPYDLAASISAARTFEDDDQVYTIGVTGKYIQSKVIETGTAGAIDLGFQWNPYRKANVAITIYNIGSKIKFKNESDSLPFKVTLGTSYEILKGWITAVDYNFPIDNHFYASLGTEYKKHMTDTFWAAIRSGYNTRTVSDVPGLAGLTAGGGFGWSRYSIDMSWQPFGALGNRFLFSLTGKF